MRTSLIRLLALLLFAASACVGLPDGGVSEVAPTPLPSATATTVATATRLPSPTPLPSATPTPEPEFPALAWLPYASGAYQGDLLAVRAGVAAREPVPESILLELYWDYDATSGRLAYAGQFWHAAAGTNKSVSDLWVYDYRADMAAQWLPDDVARARWSPVLDSDAGSSTAPLAVVARNPATGVFSLGIAAGPNQLTYLAEYATPRFSWSPDGTQIVFVRDGNYGLPSDGDTGIFLVDLAGGAVRKVAPLPDAGGAWIGDHPLWAGARRALLLAANPVVVQPLDGSAAFAPAVFDGLEYTGGRPFGMLWSEATAQLVVQTDTMLGGVQVWALHLSDDLREITSMQVISPDDDTALAGWLVPEEVVLMAARSGYGAPAAWSLTADAPFPLPPP